MGDNPYNPYNPYPFGRAGGPGTPVPPEQQVAAPVNTGAPFQPVTAPTLPIPSGPLKPAKEALPFIVNAAGKDFVLNLIFVGFLWEVWVCLYPLAAFAGFFALIYGMALLRNVLPPSPVIAPGLYVVVLGFLAAGVVLWSVSRLEHTLARFSAYRISRHLVRLPLLGLATVIMIQKVQQLPYDPSPSGVMRILKVPTNLAIAIAVMVAAHFMLWNWKWAREFWHQRLAAAQLRRRGT